MIVFTNENNKVLRDGDKEGGKHIHTAFQFKGQMSIKGLNRNPDGTIGRITGLFARAAVVNSSIPLLSTLPEAASGNNAQMYRHLKHPLLLSGLAPTQCVPSSQVLGLRTLTSSLVPPGLGMAAASCVSPVWPQFPHSDF